MDDEQSLVTDVLPLPQREGETEGYPLSSIVVRRAASSSGNRNRQEQSFRISSIQRVNG